MAFAPTGGITTTIATNFIGELWSMETIASYKANAVMRGRVTMFPHNKKKGDTINVPMFQRKLATAKAAATEVTLTTGSHGVVQIVLNKHYEKSVLIDDIVSIQSLDSLRQSYTDDAGYALARQVDFDLHVLGTGFNGGTVDASPGTPDVNTLLYGSAALIGSDGSTTWDPTASTNTGNGANLTDAGIRKIFRKMDDNNLPLSDRSIVIPPCQKEVLLGIPRFTEQAFQGSGAPISSGLIGNIYGTPVFVSTNCGNTAATDTTTLYRAVIVFHKSAMALAEQMSIRSQVQYKQEYLADLLTSDTIYGVKELRDNGGYALIVPS